MGTFGSKSASDGKICASTVQYNSHPANRERMAVDTG